MQGGDQKRSECVLAVAVIETWGLWSARTLLLCVPCPPVQVEVITKPRSVGIVPMQPTIYEVRRGGLGCTFDGQPLFGCGGQREGVGDGVMTRSKA